MAVALALMAAPMASAVSACLTHRYTESPWGIASSKDQQQPTVLDSWLKDVTALGVLDIRLLAPSLIDNANSLAGLTQVGTLYKLIDNRVPTATEWIDHFRPTVQQLASSSSARDLEVWNEPPNWATDMTPEQYALLVQASRELARSTSADFRVGLAAKSNHLRWLEASIRAGAAGQFDFVTLHPYEVIDVVSQGADGLFMGMAGNVDRMLTALGEGSKPLFLTEAGHSLTSAVTPEIQADLLVKVYVMSLAQGIAKVHWYQGMDGPSASEAANGYGLISSTGQRRPAYTALRTLIEHIGVHPRYLGLMLLNNKHPAFVFERNDLTPARLSVFSWTDPDQLARTVKFQSPARIVDPRTGLVVDESATRTSLSVTPALIEVARDSAQGQAWLSAIELRCGQPFPWGGDYAGKSLGKIKPVGPRRSMNERGVHVIAPDYAMADDGSWALRGGTGGRAMMKFAVDPNLVPYSSGAQQITVQLEVRRRDPLLPSKFQFQYESSSVVKGLGLPPTGANVELNDDEWHALTWVLPDAQFVAKDGYHFTTTTLDKSALNVWVRSVSVQRHKLP